MLNKLSLCAIACTLILAIAGCGPAPQQQDTTAAPAEKPREEPPAPVYEITKDSITDKADWTSKNVAIMGLKVGDRTNDKGKALGEIDNSRTLAEEYLTIYQKNGVFVYTTKLTGRVRAVEIYDPFVAKITDPKLKRLISSGDLKVMREILGQEEGTEENKEEGSTSYLYDSRGVRFVQFKVQGRTIYALRLGEVKKTS